MPASPTCVSCRPLPPLMPTPPTTWPSTSMGKPPTKTANLPGCMAWMPNASLPGSAGPDGGALNVWVARRWPAAVKALAMAISTPVMRAPVIRCRAIGCPPSSHTQMVSATPISLDLASAASRMMRASSSVRRLTVIIRAATRDAGSRPVHPYVAALDPHGVGRDRGAPGGQETLPGPHVVEPSVPGTRQLGPGELAQAERAAAVRARVGARVDALPDAGQHHARPVDLHQLAAARRDIREGGGRLRLALQDHMSSLRTKARWRPVMYCQRISVAWRTCSAASACVSGVVQCRSTIW